MLFDIILYMILILHIVVALSSVAYSTYMLFGPSDRKLRVSYALLVSTIVSGTYLVILHPAIMAHACMSGLVYSTVVVGMIAVARRKLASEVSRTE